MFERFTERARQVVFLAQEEARQLKHNYIGTEHILLGLLREEEGLAARVLESLDITVERVRAQVVRIVGSGEEVTSRQIPFTPRAKKVLELALREALSLGHNYIGTEHILLGLVRENEGVAARILLEFDADSEKIRNEVLRILSGHENRSADASVPGSSLPQGVRAAPEHATSEAGGLAHARVLCVASGKGGVGKSTLTANLGAALTVEGKRVGMLDADIWRYSLPRMIGLRAQRLKISAERKILPLQAHGMSVMSMAFFVTEDAPVAWSGPMLHKVLTQFIEDVAWGELDYLLIDLPPETNDVSMTLAQLLPQAQVLVVTTPQPAAQTAARRSAELAHNHKLEIAGVIENMAAFVTPSNERYPIFGAGAGPQLAHDLDVPLLGKVPLTMRLREHADSGTSLVFADPDDPASQVIRQAARLITS